MTNRTKRGRTDIGKFGRRVSIRRQSDSLSSVRDAMRGIERDIEKNDGIYPLNNGKLTLQELLRRAGKSSAYLEKKTTAMIALKAEARRWLDRVNGRIVVGAKQVRRVVTARADDATAELKAVRQLWTEAELEYIDQRQALSAANKELNRLKEENAALLGQIADRKVTPLGKR